MKNRNHESPKRSGTIRRTDRSEKISGSGRGPPALRCRSGVGPVSPGVESGSLAGPGSGGGGPWLEVGPVRSRPTQQKCGRADSGNSVALSYALCPQSEILSSASKPWTQYLLSAFRKRKKSLTLDYEKINLTKKREINEYKVTRNRECCGVLSRASVQHIMRLLAYFAEQLRVLLAKQWRRERTVWVGGRHYRHAYLIEHCIFVFKFVRSPALEGSQTYRDLP